MRDRRSLAIRRTWRCIGLGAVLALTLASAGAAASQTAVSGPRLGQRFVSSGPAVAEAADWIALGMHEAAFGAGETVSVTEGLPTFAPRLRYTLETPAIDGALAGDHLYLVERRSGRDRLVVLDIRDPGARPVPVRLRPATHGALRIARMDDHLVLAEEGFGVRILGLPHPGHARHDPVSHGSAVEPSPIGFVRHEGRLLAVTASMRTIYLAAADHLLLIDASLPALPTVLGRLALATEVRGLAANGPTVFALTREGLRVIDTSSPLGAATLERGPGADGRALAIAGRSLFVARGPGGLEELLDGLSGPQTHFVEVGDIFFNPSGTINIAIGDRVQWDKPNTAFPHNVFSCNAAQAGCDGETATQTFSSGPVTTAPFSFIRTFTLAGPNRYLCQAHTASMQGNIMVAAPPATPPAVPDGDGATVPMTVAKLDAGGVDLSIAYDTSCPDASDHDVIFGTGADLPATLGGTYALDGGSCAVGLSSPFTWTGTPAVAAGEFLWWVIVADDGASTEGSWGKDSSGGERPGPGTGGASGVCGNTQKSLANACGQ